MTGKLSNKIMRRIYFAYFMRRALHPLMMKVYVLLAAFIGVSIFTSLPHVAENLSRSGITNWFTFGTYAFIHTDMIVQLSVVAAGAMVLWIVADGVRALSGVATPRQASF